MNAVSLSLRYLRHHAASSALSVVTFASGVALIVFLLLANVQLQGEFGRNLKGIDMVVGAKGSPMQLILSGVFHLDVPTGNIPLSEAQKLRKHPLVKAAIPLALGDNYQGFRIVGTEPAYAAHYGAALQDGRYWNNEMEAVVGAQVAARSGLKVGDHFVGSHGLSEGGEAHEHMPYRVVGVLAATGSVIDRLVLTGVESVWHLHEHHDDKDAHDHDAHGKNGHHHDEDEDEHKHGPREITSLLISYSTPMAAATLPRIVNSNSALQAASPAFEMARLTRFIGISSDALKAVGAFIIVLAGLGIFVGLYNTLRERRYDMALLRSLGASRVTLCALVLSESLALALAGAALGIAAGHGALALFAGWLAESRHVAINSIVWLPEEGWLVVGCLFIGVVAAMLPAISAMRVDIFKTLVRR